METMGGNPESGELREITDSFTRAEAKQKGFTSFFKIGEMLQIKDCYFEVNNFVEEHNFMNLKMLTNKEALARMSTMLPKGESITERFLGKI